MYLCEINKGVYVDLEEVKEVDINYGYINLMLRGESNWKMVGKDYTSHVLQSLNSVSTGITDILEDFKELSR